MLIIKNILILGKGPTQGLDDTGPEAYSINFTKQEKKLCYNYNGSNSYLFVNATKIH